MVWFSTSDEGVKRPAVSSAEAGLPSNCSLWEHHVDLWKAFLCIVSTLWPPFIWIHCSLHYRCAWHHDLNTPQGILPSGYNSQHYQECVLWLFQHLQIHSAFVSRVRFHGNACRCHCGMPVTMETDGQLPDTWDLWWGNRESLLSFFKISSI